MKKALRTGLSIGSVVGLIVGFALARVDWNSLMPFSGCDYGVSSPDLEAIGLAGFGVSAPPDFSSQHFFFRTGFGDVDEYWSFVLPPDRAREFIDSYVKRTGLPAAPADSDFPDGINRNYDHEDWNQKLWFDRFEDLSEIYYQKYLFLGYSKEKNRIYLMNWND